MRQTVAAGKTPVGTKVQAKLAVATLVGGVVVPQGAILSGEVTESVAKSATDPSRLAIRMDSAQWTNGSAPIKVYLTAWYYPLATPTADQGSPSGLTGRWKQPETSDWVAPTPARGTRLHRHFRALTRASVAGARHFQTPRLDEKCRVHAQCDGAVTLTSKRFNIKLDKETTYVLAAGELARGPG